ncbi:MAG: SpoVR family protein [Candidatus Obscuribacterales bacterium]|nr:SpoVR family protein [Candidatus Obscuribacterales bacterium]
MGYYDKLTKNLKVLDPRITAAGQRMGLDPYTTDYLLVTDEQMNQNLVYVAMPVHYRHWRYGKYAQQERGGHVFEVVLNTDPSFCYLGTTNDIMMQALVIAHAKWGHVDFFKNNKLFKETGAKDILQRMRGNADFVQSLIDHPDWRWEGVELYLDAAHALEHHTGWLPTMDGEAERIENELRQKLMGDLRQMKSRYSLTNVDADKKEIEKEIFELENRLKCHPLNPTTDLLKFVADPENTQHLPPEARRLIMIVHEQSRYFQPQGRTKFMNEGWATYWEREVLVQPELGLPFNMHFPLSKYWAMFDTRPVNLYFDPYALGEAVWLWIDKKHGFDEGEVTVSYKPLILDEETGELSDSKKSRKSTVTKRNRDKMFEVRRNYDDNRFLSEFMDKDFLEHINLRCLAWMRGTGESQGMKVGLLELINNLLKRQGWGPNVTYEAMPETLSGLMDVIQNWMNMANWTSRAGLPPFPVNPGTLQEMAQILQVIEAYDADWQSLRRQLVLRTGYNSVPHVELADSGRHTDGVWTLRHKYDEDFGPLLQSEARETLRYFRLLCGGPCRLLTKEQRYDWWGRPYGDPVDFAYFTEDGDTIKEIYL